MKLIAGLGNPGRAYKKNRHNIGFMAIDRLAHELNVDVTKRKYNARYGKASWNGHDVLLVKPQTFMNLSGTSIRSFASYFKIPHEDILIIVDDVHIPFKKIRIRANSTAGGHNGIQSVIDELGTKAFARLRVGVSSPPENIDRKDYVLSDFSKEEQGRLSPLTDLISEAACAWCDRGLDSVMQQFN